ncbi:MAG: serine/threonine protein kinase [Oscillospiraceae bacterium]
MGTNILDTEYLTVRQLDKDDKGTVELVRAGDRQFILRTMEGNVSSYTALQKIASPFLPKIEYAAFDGEKTVVLEEYIIGGKDILTLTEEKDIVSAFCELCDVLGVLHSHGIVHRDIKPSNILIAPDGHIRLIDFDASRRYDDSKSGDTRCLGTKGYAPPEQFGYSQTNAASDIYSLGVTLKTVLGDRAEKRKYRRIIRKCTEFDPKNRYQSAAAVKKALKFSGAALVMPMLLLAAVLTCVLCFFWNIYIEEPESTTETASLPSETTSSAAAEQTETGTASSAVTTVTTAVKTTSSAASSETQTFTEETTTVSDAEETTTAPVTEETTAVSVTEETSASTVQTSAEASGTTAAPKKTTAAKTTTAPERETATAPPSSETASQTTSPTGLPAETTFKKLLTCVTNGTKTPAFTRYEFSSGKYCDVLNEPYEFVPDETVTGRWSCVNYTSNGTIIFPKMTFNLMKKSSYDTYPRYVVFNEDGTCYYESYSIFGMKKSLTYSSDLMKWTYGVIESPAVEEYYFYEKYYLYKDESGEEYLFVEHKNGDYMNSRNPEAGLHYYIYERYKGD